MKAGVRVAVLGAGLQGSCLAMDLASTGFLVDLFDRNPACMTQASLHNEGKVHLGYVYGNDPSLRSARAMVEGAATFGPLLERWLEIPMSRLGRSAEFNYAVHRDSLLSPADFEVHLRRTHEIVVGRIAPGDYFGLDLHQPPRRLRAPELENDYDPQVVQTVHRTSEVSIDPRVLAQTVRDRIAADHRITQVLDTEVVGVGLADDRITVEFIDRGTPAVADYEYVVNALWDGRLVVDASAGLVPPNPWLFRVKHFLMLQSATARLPSTTIVLGPFGDIVDYGQGAFYLSWYPSGLQGSSSGLEVPESLRSLPGEASHEMRAGIVAGLASITPRLLEVPVSDMDAAELSGGVIFAWGETDIDDPSSGLHSRFETGPMSVGRYHSVDTGKLTTAPLFAQRVGDRLRAAQ
ncbi:MAG TPA: FAD-dependent oxidoreductase [Acidimicrobiia bacterium]